MSDFFAEANNPLNANDCNKLEEILREPYIDSGEPLNEVEKYLQRQGQDPYMIRAKEWRAKRILGQSRSMFAHHYKAQVNTCYEYIVGKISVDGFDYLEPEIRKYKQQKERNYLLGDGAETVSSIHLPKLDEADCRTLDSIFSFENYESFESYKLRLMSEHLNRKNSYTVWVEPTKESYELHEKNRIERHFISDVDLIFSKHSSQDLPRYYNYAKKLCERNGRSDILPALEKIYLRLPQINLPTNKPSTQQQSPKKKNSPSERILSELANRGVWSEEIKNNIKANLLYDIFKYISAFLFAYITLFKWNEIVDSFAIIVFLLRRS